MRKLIPIDSRPTWKQYVSLLWCAVFHRKQHIINQNLRQRFCKVCDPQAEKKAKRVAQMWKYKSASGRKKIKEALKNL